MIFPLHSNIIQHYFKQNDSISKQIEAQAKAGGYDIVLAKGAVLYGGSDITEAVKKAVK